MPRWLPPFTLSLLLVAAGTVFWAGWELSISEETEKTETRDRTQLMAFAKRARGEIGGLEVAFEERLTATIRGLDIADPRAVRKALDELVGIALCEIRQDSSEPEILEVDYREYLPVTATLRSHRRASLPERGWTLILPSLPRFSIQREDGVWVSLTLYAPAVERAFTNVLGTLKKDFRRIQSGAEDLEEWLDPTGRPMVDAKRDSNTIDVPPDIIVPLHSRFGTWELRSWDRRTRIDVPNHGLQLGTGIASGILMLTGIGLFMNQRRTARLAAQRVSFVNRVSHELRTPLTNMLLNLDLAKDDTRMSEAARNRLNLVGEESDRLSRLIDNVLTFSRAEQGRLETELREVDLASMITQVADSFRPLLERRQIQLNVQMPDSLPWRTDPDALTQILANLLSNLEKYAPQSEARLEVSQSEAGLTIRVCDTGPGISGSHPDRVFQPFERLHNTVNEGVSGTGLGLSISRELANRLGGSLSLMPSSQGACFELKLPPPKGTDA